MLLFENTFLFKYVSTLVFYWICDQNNILGQLFDVRYVKKNKKQQHILWKKNVIGIKKRNNSGKNGMVGSSALSLEGNNI